MTEKCKSPGDQDHQDLLTHRFNHIVIRVRRERRFGKDTEPRLDKVANRIDVS